ncbi:WD40 repeat domain-containing protein [Streptomyces griseorubiginosus]|uniref:WD40 repeat domain-containing protein n=1 Tax=Streptomyces griseorubiginosus TaxID=67304 RepID=UPI0036A6FAB1
MWDLEAGTERAVLTGHTGWVFAVAVAQIDGRSHAITTGDDGTVRVWDLISARLTSVTYIPLGGTVLVVHDNTVILGMASELLILQLEKPA